MSKKISLLDACTINMGQSPDSSTYNKEGEGLPFFQGKADFGDLYPSVRYYCSDPKKVARKGDLLLSVRAPIGALNIATEECCIGRGLAALTSKPATDSIYLYYALCSLNHDLNARGTGSTFKAINKQDLADVSIPLPSLQEQERIAKTLNAVSEVLRLRKAQLAELDNLVKSQFIEMFGDPVTNPMGWIVKRLEEYTTFLTSGSRGWSGYFSDEGEMFITIKDVKDGFISIDNMQYIRAPKTKEAERTRVKKGDLLISITADLGRTGVVNAEIADYGAYINQHLSLVRLDQARINPQYVSHYLETDAGKRQFDSKNQTGVKAGLNFNAINSLAIVVPPLEKQNQFIDFVRQADKSKFAIRQSLDETQRLFDSLMAEYFEA